MVCNNCGLKYNRNTMIRPSMFCPKCGGIFVAPRKIKPAENDPASDAYRIQFEAYLDDQESTVRPWSRWSGSIHRGTVRRETPKAIHIRLDDEEEPRWIARSAIDIELAGDKVDVWIPDWMMNLGPNEIFEQLLERDWTLPESCLPKSL